MNDAEDHGLAVWGVTLITKGCTLHLPLWGRIGLISVYSIFALTVHETCRSRLSKAGTACGHQGSTQRPLSKVRLQNWGNQSFYYGKPSSKPRPCKLLRCDVYQSSNCQGARMAGLLADRLASFLSGWVDGWMDGWMAAWMNGWVTKASHWFINLARDWVIIWLAEYINSKFQREKLIISTYSNSFTTIPSVGPLFCMTAKQVHLLSKFHFNNILNMSAT
jgi:hypothetical protein